MSDTTTEKVITAPDLGDSAAQPVRLPGGSFLDKEDKQPEYALRVSKEMAEKTFAGEKTIFVFNQMNEESQNQPLYLMVDNDIVGAVKFGHSFMMSEFEFDLTKDQHFMDEMPSDNPYGYRVLDFEKFDSKITVVSKSDDMFLSIEKREIRGVVSTRVWKSSEERIVAAAVLVPGRTDLHKEIYDEETVRAAAYYFMEHYLQDEDHGIDVMHNGEIVPDSIRVLQSFVLDEEKTFEVDVPSLTSDHPVKKDTSISFPKGTWIMYARVISDTLWEKVKGGDLTGWSIAGLARVRELRKLLLAA